MRPRLVSIRMPPRTRHWIRSSGVLGGCQAIRQHVRERQEDEPSSLPGDPRPENKHGEPDAGQHDGGHLICRVSRDATSVPGRSGGKPRAGVRLKATKPPNPQIKPCRQLTLPHTAKQAPRRRLMRPTAWSRYQPLCRWFAGHRRWEPRPFWACPA
jgi:hypothetical protein